MTKRKISRKELVKDPDGFLVTSNRLLGIAVENKAKISICFGVIVAIIIAFTGFRYYSNTKENQAFTLLSQGTHKYEELIKDNSPEKGYDAVKADFNLILEKYSDKDGGKLAKMIFAKICYDGGDYDKSIELYKLALQDFDTQPFYKSRILCNLGYLYADKGDYDNAVKYFEMVEVISGSTDKDEALFNLAGIFATKGLLEKSNNTYKKLIDNYPNSTYLDISKENILP